MLNKLVAEKINEEFEEFCNGCGKCPYKTGEWCNGTLRFALDNHERIREEVLNNLPFVDRVQEGDNYYYVNGWQESVQDVFNNLRAGQIRRERKNFFETREEAEAMAEKIKQLFKGDE